MTFLCNFALFAAVVVGSRSVAAASAGMFLTGNLGRIDDVSFVAHGRGLASSASIHLAETLRQHKGAKGSETFHPGRHSNKLVHDGRGHKHLRFEQTYNDIPVVDAAIVMHADANGTVHAVNGEFVVAGSVDDEERFTCDQAFATVLNESLKNASNVVWLTDCERKVVLDKQQVAHMAWERTIQYHKDGGLHIDRLYASIATGALVAVRPQLMRALDLPTFDCHNSDDTSHCQPVTLPTTDDAVNFAIANTRATCKFYNDTFQRDPLIDMNVPIVSNVHVGYQSIDAYWNSLDLTMNYGDGDGVEYSSLSHSLDIVAHELTHSITMFSSGLVSLDESGSLNEAISDVFGACVDRMMGASVNDTWKVGEQVYTPSIANDALRYMNDPALAPGGRDFYADRYQGPIDDFHDNGGTHKNSGLFSLAFVLMVQGGKHPRGKSNVNVSPISPDFDVSLKAAAKIIYQANTACLTPMSGFLEARKCTMMHAGPYKATVAAAWDAVGVFDREAPAANVRTLSNWVKRVDANVSLSAFDYNDDTLVYALNAPVEIGGKVHCAFMSPDLVAMNVSEDMTEFRLYYGNASLSSDTALMAGLAYRESTTVAATSRTSAFAEVVIWAYNRSVEVQTICGIVPPTTAITSGVLITGLAGRAGAGTAMRVYRLAGVAKGEVVTCSTAGSTGNADLYVRESWTPFPLSDDNRMCASLSRQSTESCTIKPASKDTSVYVSVHAVKSYSNLSLLCTKCKSPGLVCKRLKECCGKNMACDGPTTATKICKKAVLAGGSCRRSTQCARGLACSSSRCTRI